MSEKFEGRARSLVAPVRRGFAIVPHDANELLAETRAIYVGSGGNLAVVLSSGDEVTFVGLDGGALLPIRALRVKATGTTAANLLGLC